MIPAGAAAGRSTFGGVTLLEQAVTHIPLVVEDIVNGEEMPCFLTVPFRHSVRIELVGNGLLAAALQVEMKNPAHNLRLRFINLKLAVYEVVPIGGSAAVEIAGFHSLLVAPPHILGYGLRFPLCGDTREGHHQFEVNRFRVDALFFKIDADAHFF